MQRASAIRLLRLRPTSQLAHLSRPVVSTLPLNRSFSLWPSKPTETAPTETLVDSATSAPPTPPLDSLYVPDVPVSTADALVSSNAVSPDTIVAPLQLGDLAAQGFSSYFPPGLYQTLLEYINVTTGMPWFWTIVVTGALTRLAVSPLTVISQQEMAKSAPISGQMLALNTRMREAYTNKDQETLAQMQEEIKALQATTGAKPGRSLASIVGQITASLAQFVGVQSLCTAQLPQLAYSGVAWVPNLLAVPPTSLSAVACGMVFIQAKLGQREQPPGSPMAPMMKWFPILMPGLTYAGITALHLPAGLVLSMATFSAVHSAQSAIMQIPAVRRGLGLLPLGTPVQAAIPPTPVQFPQPVPPKRRK